MTSSNITYIDISVTILEHLIGPLPFDIFVKRGEESFTKIFKQGERIDWQRVDSYANKKHVSSFYVKAEAHRQYMMCAEAVAQSIFQDPKLVTPEKLVSVVKDMADLTITEIMRTKCFDDDSLRQAAITVKGCIDSFKQDTLSLVKILPHIARYPYSLKHALSTVAFSFLLAKVEKIESERSLQALGVGALLHDIGMSMLSFDPDMVDEFSSDHWQEVKTHPEIGKRMLDNTKFFPLEAKLIVQQHHEQPNGGGYPNSLYGKDIFYLAKIVAIADSFSALTTKRPFRDHTYTPLEALEVMRYDRGKYDRNLVESFSKLFIRTQKKAA